VPDHSAVQGVRTVTRTSWTGTPYQTISLEHSPASGIIAKSIAEPAEPLPDIGSASCDPLDGASWARYLRAVRSGIAAASVGMLTRGQASGHVVYEESGTSAVALKISKILIRR
jgi:hypothetical protein